MNGYAVGIQNGFMSPNDVRRLEDMDQIPDELGGNLYMVNGNMMPLAMSGAAYKKEGDETSDEEVLELEESDQPGDEDRGKDSIPKRNYS